jgi:hypothetical protein
MFISVSVFMIRRKEWKEDVGSVNGKKNVKRKSKMIFKAPMQKLIHKAFLYFKVEQIYERYWNPINYAVIGGIGVLINMALMNFTITFMNWLFADLISILVAWSWNWSQSVGPFGHYWGFGKNGKNP